jgi:hypothetical protein
VSKTPIASSGLKRVQYLKQVSLIPVVAVTTGFVINAPAPTSQAGDVELSVVDHSITVTAPPSVSQAGDTYLEGDIFVAAPVSTAQAGSVSFTEDLLFGLMAHFTMNEAAGNSRLSTHGDYSLDEWNPGTDPVPSVTGKLGNAVHIPGGFSDDADLGINDGDYNPDFEPGISSFSLSFWLYPKSTSEIAAFSKGNGGSRSPGYSFAVSSLDGFRFRIGDETFNSGRDVYITRSATGLFNQWNHIVLIIDRETNYLRMYVNGVPVSSIAYYTSLTDIGNITTQNASGSYNDFRMGLYSPEYYMDQLDIYKRALQEGEVLRLYNSGSGILLANYGINGHQGLVPKGFINGSTAGSVSMVNVPYMIIAEAPPAVSTAGDVYVSFIGRIHVTAPDSISTGPGYIGLNDPPVLIPIIPVHGAPSSGPPPADAVELANATPQTLNLTAPTLESSAGSIVLAGITPRNFLTAPTSVSTSGSVSLAFASPQTLNITAASSVATAGSVVLGFAAHQPLAVTAPGTVAVAGSISLGTAPHELKIYAAPVFSSAGATFISNTLEWAYVEAPYFSSTAGVVTIANAAAQTLNITAPSAISTAGSVVVADVETDITVTAPASVSTAGSASIANVAAQTINVTAPSSVSTAGSVSVADVILSLNITAPASVSTAGSVTIAAAEQVIVVTAPASVSTAGSVVVTDVATDITVTAAASVSTAGSTTIANATPQTLNVTAPASVSSAGSVSVADVELGITITAPSAVSTAGSILVTNADAQNIVITAPSAVSTAGSVSVADVVLGITITAPTTVSTAGSTTIALATPQTLNITAPASVSTAGSVSIALAAGTWILEDGTWDDTGVWDDTATWNDGVQEIIITAPATVSTAGSVSIADVELGITITAPAAVSTAGSTTIAEATPQTLNVTAPSSVSTAGSTTIALATPQTLNITAPAAISTAGSTTIALATPQTLNVTAPASVSTAGSVSIAAAGGTEDLAPDSTIVSQTTFSETNTANIDDDPDSPDANWALIGGNNVNGAIRVSFPTPTGSPKTGAGLQEFRAELRQQSVGQTGTPTARLDLYETGGSVLQTGTEQNITSESSQVISETWDATLLATADGSAVEVDIVVTKSGGSPSARESCDIGAVKWVCEYTG